MRGKRSKARHREIMNRSKTTEDDDDLPRCRECNKEVLQFFVDEPLCKECLIERIEEFDEDEGGD